MKRVILLLSLLVPLSGFAEMNKKLFTEKNLKTAIATLTNNAPVEATDKVQIKAPSIAENGAEVGVRVSSTLKNIEQITLFADSNQYPLVASYRIPDGSSNSIRSRIKIGKNANLIAVVKADGKYYQAKQFVKVTIGGCGGAPGDSEAPAANKEKDNKKDAKKQ